MPDRSEFWNILLGRLSLDSLPLDNTIVMGTFVVVAIFGVCLLAYITRIRKWGYLWHEWFTSVDHKKLGIMYMILGTVMLLRGFSDHRIAWSQHGFDTRDQHGHDRLEQGVRAFGGDLCRDSLQVRQTRAG